MIPKIADFFSDKVMRPNKSLSEIVGQSEAIPLCARADQRRRRKCRMRVLQ